MITMDMPATSRLMIDARLDSIERALMAQGMGRGDRHQILAAIEDQILEMLSRIEGQEPTREDVLSTLARLDPPEAYLELSTGELTSYQALHSSPRQADVHAQPGRRPAPRLNVLAVVAFVLTCLAMLGSVTWWFLSFYGLLPLAMLTIAAGICGTIALHQFSLDGQTWRGKWMAVTACACTPAVSFVSWIVLLVVEGF